jgi:2-(1,2-epoxy-1,2-dihydrophenyl)acetyl-CoA isomerase
MLRALNDAILRCSSEPEVRAVLLTGAGKNFCGGGDVKEFASHGEALPDYLRVATTLLNTVALGLIRLDVPVVTSVQGFAAGGGGLGLVCASDLVVIGRSTKFLSAATRVAMAPDAGTTVTLTQIVGFRRAMELVLTEKLLRAEEALEIGLVTRVVEDDALAAESEALALQLARGATKALGATKRLMWSGLGSSVERGLPDESRTVSELSGRADAREGLAAVIERRAPVFDGR